MHFIIHVFRLDYDSSCPIVVISYPLSVQILDEMPVFYNLNAVEKREVLIVVLQIVRNLDDASLVKAWQQSIARTRLFFKLMEEGLILFEVAILFMFLVVEAIAPLLYLYTSHFTSYSYCIPIKLNFH